MTLRRYRSTITTTGTPRSHKRIGITYLLQVGWDKPRLGRCVPRNPVITDCAISSFDVTGHHPPKLEEFGRSNRRAKNSARGDAGRVKWRKASEFSKTRSRHLWAPSIRGPRALATYTCRRVPTSNRPNRRGRPHLGDTYIALWFASSRPHRCKPRRPTPSLHQQASRPTVNKTALPRCFIAISLSFRSCGENVSLAIWLPSRGKRAKWNSFHPRRLIEQVGVHLSPYLREILSRGRVKRMMKPWLTRSRGFFLSNPHGASA